MDVTKKDEPLSYERAWAKFRAVDWISPLVLAGFGGFVAFELNRPTEGPPICDGQPMGPGSSCIVFGGGRSYTYEEKMAEYAFNNDLNRAVLPLFVAVIALLLAVLIFRGIVEPRLARVTPPPAGGEPTGHVHSTWLRGVGPVVGLLLFLLGYNWFQDAQFRGHTGIEAAIPWGFALLVLFAFSLRPRRFVQLSEQGAQIATGARVSRTSWADARVVERPGKWIRILGPDGAAKVSTRFSDHEAMWTRIRFLMLATHLRPALEEFAAGRTVDFGSVQADEAAIRAGGGVMPWARVGTLTADSSTFTIAGSDGTNVAVPVGRVENRWVFEQIVELIVRGLRQQQQQPPPIG